MAIETYPQIGIQVKIILVTGGSATGNWDGLQWWAGVDGQPDDIPIVNSFVDRWEELPQV